MNNLLGLVFLMRGTSHQFKSTFGVSYEEFGTLHPVFARHLEEQNQREAAIKWSEKPRKRKTEGGRKAALPDSNSKLAFLLYYFKEYPKFDTLGAIFGMSGGKANKYVHTLWPILVDSLCELEVLPRSDFASLADFESYLRQNGLNTSDKILVDVTEQMIERPKSR